MLQEDAFAVTDGDMETDDPQRSQAEASTAGNPTAVLLTTDEGELAVFKEWCVYGKYRYRAYTAWPDAAALDGADVVLVGRMPYGAASLATLTAYAQTGITLLFTRLPAYDLLAGDPALADFFGITQCMEPARRVDGLKLFANFFLSKERIYTAGDFYGDLDDTRFTLPYYTLRTGYEGYMVGMLDDQKELGIENEELPTLLWRTRTGRSQICVVNTDLFDGERMLGVLTAFVSATSDWHLYPVVNARTILMTDFPFLSNENTAAMRKRYSRDTLGFQRDIVWPNVVKVLRNYEAVPNFFLSPQLDYTDGVEPVTDDLAMYLRQIQGLSGTVGLSLLQTSGLSLSEVVDKAAAYFEDALPDYRFYAAFGGNFTDDAWQAYLSGDRDALLSDLSLLLFPYREGRALFTLPDGQVLSALMTTDGFTHETPGRPAAALADDGGRLFRPAGGYGPRASARRRRGRLEQSERPLVPGRYVLPGFRGVCERLRIRDGSPRAQAAERKLHRLPRRGYPAYRHKRL